MQKDTKVFLWEMAFSSVVMGFILFGTAACISVTFNLFEADTGLDGNWFGYTQAACLTFLAMGIAGPVLLSGKATSEGKSASLFVAIILTVVMLSYLFTVAFPSHNVVLLASMVTPNGEIITYDMALNIKQAFCNTAELAAMVSFLMAILFGVLPLVSEKSETRTVRTDISEQC